MVNLITALSGHYMISLVARFFAGVFGSVVWSLLGRAIGWQGAFGQNDYRERR
ncbi:hypothetical protein [Edaphovirga cremea]|uniref:hypothetical protein n=1 Tax=Edaphovirga cremea TaxID=2267246 RepID=UPI00398A250F